MNINEEIKNLENNINENNNNNIKNKDNEPDLFLFLNYTNNNFNYTVNGDVTIKKYNSMRNDYGKKKKTSVLLLKTHDHFNSAMNSFNESNSKENNEYDLESEYYNNCSINTLYKKSININSENDLLLFNNKTNNDSKSYKYFTNNLHNNTENSAKTYNKNKLANNSFASKPFYIKEKIKLYLIIKKN